MTISKNDSPLPDPVSLLKAKICNAVKCKMVDISFITKDDFNVDLDLPDAIQPINSFVLLYILLIKKTINRYLLWKRLFLRGIKTERFDQKSDIVHFRK